MDVNSGEILAMTSLPQFDPNAPDAADPDSVFNRATKGVYEMGSTFKLFTASMALDTGAVTVNGGYDASKPIHIARFTIDDYHGKKRWLSVPEILIYSSNIGAAKMALDVGGKTQQAYLERLGMLRPAPLELPEVGSPLKPGVWRDINTMTIGYGHGLAVTPVHMAAGVAAVVNGGIFHPATILKRDPQRLLAGERVFSAETSAKMRAIMRQVVTSGTGSNADLAEYRVGGKTGTAEKLSKSGGYLRHALVSSFIAAFPIDAPRYVTLIMVDEPKGNKKSFGFATGGWVAAPATGRLIRRIGVLAGIEPDSQNKAPASANSLLVNAAHRPGLDAEPSFATR
jgi:cell division protein FtsI (penicillin-binding protein 3)